MHRKHTIEIHDMSVMLYHFEGTKVVSGCSISDILKSFPLNPTEF